jgi:hypothetical protein
MRDSDNPQVLRAAAAVETEQTFLAEVQYPKGKSSHKLLEFINLSKRSYSAARPISRAKVAVAL